MNGRLAQYRPYGNRLLRKDRFSGGELLNLELLTVVSTDFGEVVISSSNNRLLQIFWGDRLNCERRIGLLIPL
jgi:hypothetical protein